MKVQGDAVHKSGVTWCADNNVDYAMSATNALNLKGVDTMTWWANDGCGSVAGIAYIAALCSQFGLNLNEKSNSVAQSAYVSTVSLVL